MFMLLLAFSAVILMCLLKFNFVSNVTPSILGFLSVGISTPFIVRDNVLLNSDWSVVKSVAEDLVGFN